MKRIRTKYYGRFPDKDRTSKDETAICERLKAEDFAVSKSSRYGFPYQPTCLAYDTVQCILAIGTYSGALRILGRPGVESHVQHDSSTPVRNLLFLVNEGALISNCPEDCIHLWNLRQEQPVIVQSLRFNRERITCLHLPYKSRWLYVGTEKGNVHVVNIEKFELSGYTINWNKAIDIKCKTHPGPVVQITDNPVDSNKILLGYESGTVAVWSLRDKSAEQRFICSQKSLTSMHWLNDGKQFICAHSNGSLSLWMLKTAGKPVEILTPHGMSNRERPCAPINKVEWLGSASGDPLIIFSGGTMRGKRKGLTLCHGKSTKLLTTESILDFTSVMTTPWPEEMQDPRAIIAITPARLLVFDVASALSSKPVTFDVPYAFEIHESPVTCTQYITECPPDLIRALREVGGRPKKKLLQREASRQPWPITGGAINDRDTDDESSELIITGHADGTVRFWDASSVTIQQLYKLSTLKLFDKDKHKSSSESSDSDHRRQSQSEGSESGDHLSGLDSKEEETEAFSIQQVELCTHSRTLVVCGATYALVYLFSSTEQAVELVQVDIHLTADSPTESLSSPEHDTSDRRSFPGLLTPPSFSLPSLFFKTGTFRRHPGFQPELGCVTAGGADSWPVSSVSISSQYGLISVCCGPSLALIDIVQKKIVTVLSAQEMTMMADAPSVATPVTAAPTTPLTTNAPISLTLNLALGGIDFSDAAVQISKDKKVKPPRPPAPIIRMKSVNKGEGSNGADSSDGVRARTPSGPTIESPPDIIQCTRFACTFTKKHDNWISPCILVGTGQGSVFVVVINMPPAEERHLQPILTITTGTVYKPKAGSIMTMAVLDSQGHLFPSPMKFWTDKKEDAQHSNQTVNARESSDRHFLVVCSEVEAKTYQLPPSHSSPSSHTKASVADDTSVVVSANVLTIEGSSCLVCLNSVGRLMTFSLPSLNSIMDVDCNFLLTDFRFLRTLRFSDGGKAIIMCSPFEIQRMSIFTRAEDENGACTLFSAVAEPEPPNKGFFSSLFASSASPLDREQLFGSESGAASRSVAERMQGPGIEHLQETSVGLGGAMQKNREMLAERGEKLSQVEKKTAEMAIKSKAFADAAHGITLKYKDKKWYQV
ncbi:syntaxin-binding protein 5 [Nematostella vectensis]|uniref:syntaxin-binding protein 5 n=1 Tax=Nematostella vectensis TaxID=45351 RepID=UPI0020776488|nr:syntaxin-binding protein 5 [Nematostella vectensis]